MDNKINWYGCGLSALLACLGCNRENDRPMTPASGTYDSQRNDNGDMSPNSPSGADAMPPTGSNSSNPGSSSSGGSSNGTGMGPDTMSPGTPGPGSQGTGDGTTGPHGTGSGAPGPGSGPVR